MKKRIFRSLRTRTSITLTVMFLFMLIIVTIIIRTLSLDNIRKLEKQNATEHMTRVWNSITYELNDLKKTAMDWAEWTDTYNFVTDYNETYISDNLSAIYLNNLRLDAMVFIDASGDFVYAKQLNANKDELQEVPSNVISLLKTLIGDNQDINRRVQGLLSIPGGAMLVATNPILTSNSEGPIHGNLVLYRFLDQTEVAHLSELTNQNITLTFIGSQHEYDQRNDPEEMFVSITEISDHKIQGTSTLKDIYGNPAIDVSILMNRDMYLIGQAGFESIIFVLLAIGIIFSLLIILLLDRIILSRIQYMSAAINAIGEHNDPQERLKPDEMADELSTMSHEINAMLDKLQASRLQIEAREHELIEIAAELKQEMAGRIEAQERITYLAYHDPLTNLPNRLHFTEHLNHGIQLAKRMARLVAILFLDLDGFKMINDSMGHQAGDLLLIEVSKRLKAMLRASDVLARLGGDEFVILLEDIADASAIEIIAGKVLNIFSEPFILNRQECFISTSIGVAVYPVDGETGEVLIKNADIAMYHAKERGKNQYVLCSPSIKNRVMETMKMSNQLFRALERKEFEVYYQPQINCSTNLIVGAEALIRWNHPELGQVLPGMFIPIAEQTGLILPIGEWVLHTSCVQAKAWQIAGYPRIRMGVNLSIRQFQNHDIAGEVQAILEDTNLDPEYLELEITESIAVHEKDYVFNALFALRDMGIHISIDDFGTEYSSMNHLKQLPVDRIKIPMPFVQGIDASPKDEAITKSIIVLAKSLGLKVTAEGVETKAQYDFLTQRMCDEIQGYYYFKPMTASDFEKLLELQRKQLFRLC